MRTCEDDTCYYYEEGFKGNDTYPAKIVNCFCGCDYCTPNDNCDCYVYYKAMEE